MQSIFVCVIHCLIQGLCGHCVVHISRAFVLNTLVIDLQSGLQSEV